VVVVSTSLNPQSRSHILAVDATQTLQRLGADATLIDLRENPLPLCDGSACYSDPGVEKLSARIERAQAILIATPIYNFDVNASAKNLIELTGDAFTEKPVGFLVSAGGRSSYMAPIGIANSLMFDFRSWVVPRFVYATREDFHEDLSLTPRIRERIEQLSQALLDLTRALDWVKNERAQRVAGRSS
jgi:FMN reductase